MLFSVSSAKLVRLTFSIMVACTCLSSCSLDLLSQHKPKTKPATEVANKPSGEKTVAMALGKVPRASVSYTDPLVSTRPMSQKRPATGLMAHNNQPRRELPLTSNPSETQNVTDAVPVADNMAALVKQPTAVSANSNSLYSLANAQIAASEGVPAYAPVRNINPMAGSVFSAPVRQMETTAAPAKPANADGLW